MTLKKTKTHPFRVFLRLSGPNIGQSNTFGGRSNATLNPVEIALRGHLSTGQGDTGGEQGAATPTDKEVGALTFSVLGGAEDGPINTSQNANIPRKCSFSSRSEQGGRTQKAPYTVGFGFF
jgi:hypothetical protein